MKINIFVYYLAFVGIAITALSCNNDDTMTPNEPEVITTAILSLVPEGGTESINLVWRDLDGDGANPPEITGDTLAANTRYTTALILLNETTNPAINITAEILLEDIEHQAFYNTTVSGMTILYNDMDIQGYPLGLEMEVNTGGPSGGTINVVLRHMPDKAAEGVAQGNIANANGETDLNVDFPVTVL